MKQHSLESSNAPLRVAFLLSTGLVLHRFLGSLVSPLPRGGASMTEYLGQQLDRDIKPENMLLGCANEVLLSDFGIAVIIQSSRQQQARNAAGTLAYMAPEQLQGKPRPASDQYALGVVVYEWLCGDCPFHGTFAEL